MKTISNHRTRVRAARRLATPAAALVLAAITWLAPPELFSQQDPRSPYLCEMPLLGTMEGFLEKHPLSNNTEFFGMDIDPIVEPDGRTSAWIVQRQRVDSPWVTITGNHLPPTELLLYRPVAGGLPDVRSGVRIGPAEVYSKNRFITCGDWDGDGRADILLSQVFFGDSTQGPGGYGYELVRAVVYWQQSDGGFTTSDTSHLQSVSEVWSALTEAYTGRLGDGEADDLLIWGGRSSWVDGRRVAIPLVLIFEGGRGRRWGRDGVSRLWSWGLWRIARNPTFVTQFNRMDVMDTDGDGADDIVFYTEGSNGNGVEVLYGRHGQLPDTNDRESVDVAVAGGVYIQLQDLTGDRIPELTFTTGTNFMVRVYMGSRGQRLREMFGSGFDPERPGEPRGWARPWAEIWMPAKFGGGWHWGNPDIFPALGDGNLDGISDLWAFSPPYLVRYDGGRYLDNYVDGLARSGTLTMVISKLGDIDSSGVPTAAMGLWTSNNPLYDRDRGTIRYYKLAPCNSARYPVRELPPGTDSVASARPATETLTTLQATISPIPARTSTLIRWTSDDCASTVTLTTILGTAVRRWTLPPSTRQLSVDLGDLPRGSYLLGVRTCLGARIVPVSLQ